MLDAGLCARDREAARPSHTSRQNSPRLGDHADLGHQHDREAHARPRRGSGGERHGSGPRARASARRPRAQACRRSAACCAAKAAGAIVFGRTKHGVKKLQQQPSPGSANNSVVAFRAISRRPSATAPWLRSRAGRSQVLVATNVAARGIDRGTTSGWSSTSSCPTPLNGSRTASAAPQRMGVGRNAHSHSSPPGRRAGPGSSSAAQGAPQIRELNARLFHRRKAAGSTRSTSRLISRPAFVARSGAAETGAVFGAVRPAIEVADETGRRFACRQDPDRRRALPF